MPTPHKRDAVLLRPEASELVSKLCEETSLSRSKQISVLVEEALKARGMYGFIEQFTSKRDVTPDNDPDIDIPDEAFLEKESDESLTEQQLLERLGTTEGGFSIEKYRAEVKLKEQKIAMIKDLINEIKQI